MRKNILRMTAAVFATALTGILACSSDPCQQMGCGGTSSSANCTNGSSSTGSTSVTCPSGYTASGNVCVKN